MLQKVLEDFAIGGGGWCDTQEYDSYTTIPGTPEGKEPASCCSNLLAKNREKTPIQKKPRVKTVRRGPIAASIRIKNKERKSRTIVPTVPQKRGGKIGSGRNSVLRKRKCMTIYGQKGTGNLLVKTQSVGKENNQIYTRKCWTVGNDQKTRGEWAAKS